MIISAKIITPRSFRRCCWCGGIITRSALRLYGAAERGDPPYVVYMHPSCTQDNDPKIVRAKSMLVDNLTA
jgi:hypothetical protein